MAYRTPLLPAIGRAGRDIGFQAVETLRPFAPQGIRTGTPLDLLTTPAGLTGSAWLGERAKRLGGGILQTLGSSVLPESTKELGQLIEGDRPLGPEGEQPSPGGGDTGASSNARQAKLPGAGLTGAAFTKAIQEATAPGAAVREAAMGAPTRAGRLPRLAEGGITEAIREGAYDFTPDPWGVDVSQAGMAQNEIARQAIEGRHINRLAAIAAAEEAAGGSPQERDLVARKLNLEATALTEQPRPLEGKGGAFRVGPQGTISNVPARPPATQSQLQAAIFDRVRVAGQGLADAYGTGDKAKIAEATLLYERILRESELQLSSLAGRPIIGSRPGALDLGVGSLLAGQEP